ECSGLVRARQALQPGLRVRLRGPDKPWFRPVFQRVQGVLTESLRLDRIVQLTEHWENGGALYLSYCNNSVCVKMSGEAAGTTSPGSGPAILSRGTGERHPPDQRPEAGGEAVEWCGGANHDPQGVDPQLQVPPGRSSRSGAIHDLRRP